VSATRLRSPSSQAISVSAPLLLVAALAALGAAGTVSFQDTVTLILCNLIVVCGLQVFIGNSGIYSFGQVGFAAAGGYLAALLTLPAAFVALQTPGLPSLLAGAGPGPLVATLIAALACGLLAAIVGVPLMRTSTLAIPISTFAFLIVTYNVIANWGAVTGGSAGLVSIPTSTSPESAGLWAAAAILVALAFKWSPSGYRLQATRENEIAARSLGIRLTRERLLAFTISGVLCGAGGALAVHQSGVLTPATFYFGATVTTLTMLVVGGSRSVFGAVLGATMVAVVDEFLRHLEEGFHLFGLVSIGEAPGLAAIGLGVILLATMIGMPAGLTGGREAGELTWFRRRHPHARASRRPGAQPPIVIKNSRPAPARGALRAEGVSVAFAGLKALRDVDLTLGRGEILGLIGPNGAGKTTLVNVLSGFQTPDSGTIRLDGEDVTRLPPARLARAGLARTFQSALPFAHLSALEGVAVGAMGVGVGIGRASATATSVLDRLGLGELAQEPAGALPPGIQRLLGIARALATSPSYLLLDEPAAGLNDAECRGLVEALRGVLADFGCGILLIEHDMSVVMDLCPRIQVLEDGATLRIGSPAETQTDPAVIEAYLGHSFLAGAGA
jgi:branched-chain amino acid transport system permease protein